MSRLLVLDHFTPDVPFWKNTFREVSDSSGNVRYDLSEKIGNSLLTIVMELKKEHFG